MTTPNLFDEPVSQPFARGSHTSWKAARQVNAEHRQTITAAYLSLLVAGPLSDEQAFQQLRQWFRVARSSLSSIRQQCIVTGLVERGTEIRQSAMGRDVHVWGLTQAGRKAQA